MGYAFISYSTKNQSAADAMRRLLRKNGVDTWMAPYDIPAGSEYAEVLYDALTGCSCLVLLLTGDSQDSRWVKKEVNIAISNGKTVIPVKLEDVELNSVMKLYLNDQQIVPVHTLDEDSDDVQKVLRSVTATTGQTLADAPSQKEKVRQVLEDGSVYEGELTNGKRTGKGKLTLIYGSCYEGDFVDGKRHGKGKMTYSDGSVYEGDFVYGKPHGRGKYNCSGLFVYEGDFADDRFHGMGKITWADGTFDEGDFVHGALHGKGKKTYSDGSIYEGDFIKGECTGKGKITWANGDVYEGDFVDDKPHGNGKITKANGCVKEGRFENGTYIGKA